MIFAKNFARNYEKKIIVGTSDSWLMSHLFKQTNDQAPDVPSIIFFS